MRPLAVVAGCVLLAVVLIDTFNTIVLPRRTEYGFRITVIFYRFTYRPFAAIARRIQSGHLRESYLSVYGPLSLLLLIGVWVLGIVVAFGLLDWAAGVQWHGRPASLFDSVYLSSTTFATLGTGELANVWVKLFAMLEGLLGLGFLGLNVGYLPTFYQSFSRREIEVSLLDGRAGSPPSALGLIQCEGRSLKRLEDRLADWEGWAAQIMEAHLSYPMLALFRSHHANQSWLTALVAVVDAAAITLACSEGDLRTQAGLTFAMGRHALADISVIFKAGQIDQQDRLTPAAFHEICDILEAGRTVLHPSKLSEGELSRLRRMYEPFASGLSHHFLMAMPAWVAESAERDWQISGSRSMAQTYSVSDPFGTEEPKEPH